MRDLPTPPSAGQQPQSSREVMGRGDATLMRRMMADDVRQSGREEATRRVRNYRSNDLMQGLTTTSDELVRNVDRHNRILRDILRALTTPAQPATPGMPGRGPRASGPRTRQQRQVRMRPPSAGRPIRDGRRVARETFSNRRPTVSADAQPSRPRPQASVPGVTRPRPSVVRPGIAGAVIGGAMAGLAGDDVVGGAVVGGGVAAGVSIATHLADQRIRQQLTRHVSGRISERVLTKIPVAGLLVSLFFAGQRAYAGDWVGAGLEVAAGTAGALGPLTFGIGTGVALGLDAAALARDAYSIVYGVNIEEDPQRDERLAALTVAVGEVITEMMANRPRPTTPPINTETRDRLLQIYRSIGDDEAMINFIGPDVIAAIRGLLTVDIEGDGLQQRRARESIERVLGSLSQRMSAAPQRVSSNDNDSLLTLASSAAGEEKEDAVLVKRDSATGADDEGVDDSDARTSSSDLPYPENLIDMMSKTEFDEINIEADDITFDGEIEVIRDTAVLPSAAQPRPVRTITPETPDYGQMVTRISSSATPATAQQPPSPSMTSPVQAAETQPAATQVAASPVTPALAGAPSPVAAPGGGGTGEQISQIVQAGAGYTTVQYADGRVERRTGARNWRNNNPGNVEFGDFARRYGAIGSDGRFAVFPTYDAGRAAKEALLFEGRNYRSLTIEQAMMRYAPPSENNTASYINSIVQAVGVPASTPLQSLSADQRRSMLSVMERVEGFRVGRVDVLQQGRPAESVAQVPAAPSTGGQLASSGAEMVVDDQMRMREAGSAGPVIIAPQAQHAAAQQTPRPTRVSGAEVPLNRRLELQVA